MPRIPLVSKESLTEEQRPVYDAIVSVGSRGGAIPAPYQLTLHCPELTDKWQQIGGLLRFRTSLPLRLSELAILVTARHWDCQYEWYGHEPEALRGGLSPAVIDAIRMGERPRFEKPDEEWVYDYCRELHERHFVSDAVYQRVLGAFGITGVVELTALVGYYAMVAMALNAHQFPLPAGVTSPLPPVGR